MIGKIEEKVSRKKENTKLNRKSFISWFSLKSLKLRLGCSLMNVCYHKISLCFPFLRYIAEPSFPHILRIEVLRDVAALPILP